MARIQKRKNRDPHGVLLPEPTLFEVMRDNPPEGWGVFEKLPDGSMERVVRQPGERSAQEIELHNKRMTEKHYSKKRKGK